MPLSIYITVPRNARQPIPSNRWCRNGQYPDVGIMGALRESANQLIYNRPKELFRSVGDLVAAASVTGTRNRWRFGAHTGPYLGKLKVAMLIAQESDRTTGHNPNVTLAISSPTGTALGSVTVYAGAMNGAAETDAPFYYSYGIYTVPSIAADTDIVGLFTDNDKSRIVAATVYEEPLDPIIGNGYVMYSGLLAPILDTDRSNIRTIAHAILKRGSAQLFNWTTDVDTDARSATVGTVKNIVDNTSTTVTAATPGFTLDTRYHNRVSQGALAVGATPGMPVCIAMYGNRGAGTAGNQGIVIKNSAGTTVLTTTGLATTDGWVFDTSNAFPAANDKFDVQVFSNNGTCTIKAVSIFEYEA